MGACATKSTRPRGGTRDVDKAADSFDEYGNRRTSQAGTAANIKRGLSLDSEVDSPADSSVKRTSQHLDTSRRRLSVSTVSHDGIDTVFSDKGAAHLNAQKNAAVGQGSGYASNESTATTPQGLRASSAGGGSSLPKKRRIKTFNDPAMELVDEATATIRPVTVDMIQDLIIQFNHTYFLFGAACQEAQKGFDDKLMDLQGSVARSLCLADVGVGFACKKGLKPESPNQDDFAIVRVDDWQIYAVFDGHGPCGHEVSSTIHRMLLYLIISDEDFEANTPAVFRRAFRKAHHLLEAMCEHPDAPFDCTLSGTTGTVVLHRDNKLYIAHVGDSRAVMATMVDGQFQAVDLTNDHKPMGPEEKRRIESCGGEVRQLEGDVPHRVFVKNRMYPGLAMSRAIGDTVGAAVGVVPDPDVRVVELGSQDQFVIVSTDGVWEFISSQEAVDFVCRKKKLQVQHAAEFLAYESWRRWVEEEETVVDDVTCIVFWLGDKGS